MTTLSQAIYLIFPCTTQQNTRNLGENVWYATTLAEKRKAEQTTQLRNHFRTNWMEIEGQVIPDQITGRKYQKLFSEEG